MTALEKENLIDHVRNRYSYQLGIELANFFTKQEKKDKLLELYRYVWKTPILSQTISFEEAINRIDNLEKELRELK